MVLLDWRSENSCYSCGLCRLQLFRYKWVSWVNSSNEGLMRVLDRFREVALWKLISLFICY